MKDGEFPCMQWVTMQVLGMPTLTMATYIGIILLFLVSALYVGMKFEALPLEDIEAMADEVNQDD